MLKECGIVIICMFCRWGQDKNTPWH